MCFAAPVMRSIKRILIMKKAPGDAAWGFFVAGSESEFLSQLAQILSQKFPVRLTTQN
jgi:hypothetical protein